MKKNLQEVEQEQEPTFTKGQLRGANRYVDKRDLVEALLVDGQVYTISQVDQAIKEYMEGGTN